jgi:hypothetical protein
MRSMVGGAFFSKWRRAAPSAIASRRSPSPASQGRISAAAPKPQSRTWLTMPSASFGSNQVDFGGMISPASATAMRSAIRVG